MPASFSDPRPTVWGPETSVSGMPKGRRGLVVGIGHSMNLECPALYAGYVGSNFGGLAR